MGERAIRKMEKNQKKIKRKSKGDRVVSGIQEIKSNQYKAEKIYSQRFLIEHSII